MKWLWKIEIYRKDDPNDKLTMESSTWSSSPFKAVIDMIAYLADEGVKRAKLMGK